MLDLIRRSFFLIDGHRLWIVIYVVTAIFSSVIEAAGLASVFIFFSIAMSPENFGGISLITAIHEWLGQPPTNDFLSGIGFFVAFAFVLRSVALLLVNWLSLAFQRRLQLNLTQILLATYMQQPLLWHLRRTESRLISNLSYNISHVSQHLIVGALDLFATITTTLALLFTMISIRPLESFVVVTISGIILILFLLILRPYLVKWGSDLVHFTELTWRTMREALSGIKTIKVLGIEDFFSERVNSAVKMKADLVLVQSMWRAAPRYFIEALLIGGILLSVPFALSQGIKLETIIPTLILFAGASIRLLPQLVNMSTLYQYMKLSETPLNNLCEDLSTNYESASIKEVPSSRALDEFNELNLSGVSFEYEKGKPVLIDVALDIRKGERVALVGLSGAGKTTLIDLLLGLLKPDSGTISLNGEPTSVFPKNLFGYVPQEPFLIEGSIKDNIVLGIDCVDEDRLQTVLDQSALRLKIENSPDGVNSIIKDDGGQLSGGERQRLGIARVLYHNAPILLLDEPTSSLDAITEEHVSNALRELGKESTIVVVAHRLSTIKDFDRIIYMQNGKIEAEGDFAKLYSMNNSFRSMVDFLSLHPKI